jgi:hypothetical protein
VRSTRRKPGGYDWHYEGKVPLDDSAPQQDPSVSLVGTGPGKYASATGATTISGYSYCNGSSGDSTATDTLESALDGTLAGAGDFDVPVPGDTRKPDVSVVLSSSADEHYHTVQTGHCPRDGAADAPLWWTDVRVAGVTTGDAQLLDSGQPAPAGIDPASAIMVKLDQPLPGDPPNLIAKKTLSASDGRGYSGETEISLIQDPRHVAFPGLDPVQ